MSECEKNATECQTHGSGCEGGQTSCQPCLPPVSCPVEKSAGMWTGAFFQAMRETQTEILKEKIRKAWGAQMEKVGDAVVESMGIQWQSMLAQAKAHGDLRDQIRKIYQSGQK